MRLQHICHAIDLLLVLCFNKLREIVRKYSFLFELLNCIGRVDANFLDCFWSVVAVVVVIPILTLLMITINRGGFLPSKHALRFG